MIEKMKPSGIAWIGDIPVGWDIKKIKYVIQNDADGIKVGPFGSALTNVVVSGEEGQYKIYGQANLIRKDFNYLQCLIETPSSQLRSIPPPSMNFFKNKTSSAA